MVNKSPRHVSPGCHLLSTPLPPGFPFSPHTLRDPMWGRDRQLSWTLGTWQGTRHHLPGVEVPQTFSAPRVDISHLQQPRCRVYGPPLPAAIGLKRAGVGAVPSPPMVPRGHSSPAQGEDLVSTRPGREQGAPRQNSRSPCSDLAHLLFSCLYSLDILLTPTQAHTCSAPPQLLGLLSAPQWPCLDPWSLPARCPRLSGQLRVPACTVLAPGKQWGAGPALLKAQWGRGDHRAVGASGRSSWTSPVWSGCEASGPVSTGAFNPSLLFLGVQDRSSGPKGRWAKASSLCRGQGTSMAPTDGVSPAARAPPLWWEKKTSKKLLLGVCHGSHYSDL